MISTTRITGKISSVKTQGTSQEVVQVVLEDQAAIQEEVREDNHKWSDKLEMCS